MVGAGCSKKIRGTRGDVCAPAARVSAFARQPPGEAPMIRPAAFAVLLPFLLLAFVLAPAAAAPLDCAQSPKGPLKVICTDPTLATLGKEADRLADLAAGRAGNAKKELADSQASFRKTLAACGDAKPCLQRTLIDHIHHLRQGYADARSRDSEGISLGPLGGRLPRPRRPGRGDFRQQRPDFRFPHLAGQVGRAATGGRRLRGALYGTVRHPARRSFGTKARRRRSIFRESHR